MYDNNSFRSVKESTTHSKHPFHIALAKQGIPHHKFLTNAEYNQASDMHQKYGEKGLKTWIANRKIDLQKRGILKESDRNEYSGRMFGSADRFHLKNDPEPHKNGWRARLVHADTGAVSYLSQRTFKDHSSARLHGRKYAVRQGYKIGLPKKNIQEESFLVEKEQDEKMKQAGYKLIGRTNTKDPKNERGDVTYSVYGRGARRKIIRTKGGKQVHEGFYSNQKRLADERAKRKSKKPIKLKPNPNPREDD